MMMKTMVAGTAFPAMSWPALGGGTINPAEAAGWRVLVVYRGAHCPLCKIDLDGLKGLLPDYEAAGIGVSAVSADTSDKANAQVERDGWRFPLGYGLEPAQMKALGLYVSEPRSAQETDRPFAEPGIFVINPDGKVQVVDTSNAPFARPDLKVLLNGLKFVIGNGYPISLKGLPTPPDMA